MESSSATPPIQLRLLLLRFGNPSPPHPFLFSPKNKAAVLLAFEKEKNGKRNEKGNEYYLRCRIKYKVPDGKDMIWAGQGPRVYRKKKIIL
ncbi:hypothetical protein OUZ56_026713 [Daphnia magna]|uniref:Uncharacterized protein n=1 Tax=Daphnia magna TaxID=35525 RepID=A0ABQ9ZMK2_9CRUS|nr:hypothetical protein OUZ56_026713 [Daphnia magna]